MTIKWSVKDVLEYAKELKSPFEENKQNGQGRGGLVGLAEKIKEIAGRNRGITK